MFLRGAMGFTYFTLDVVVVLPLYITYDDNSIDKYKDKIFFLFS